MTSKEEFARFCAEVEMVAVERWDDKLGVLHINWGQWELIRSYWDDMNDLIPIVEVLMKRDGNLIEFKISKVPLSLADDFRNYVISKMEDTDR